MNPIDSKLKKILAMIDGATSEGEARAASLALQRLLAANNMTIDETAIASVSFRGSRTPTASSSSRTRPWPWRSWCPRASTAT